LNRNRKIKNKNLLDLVPVRMIEYKVETSGLVTLLKERHKSRFMKWLAVKFNKSKLIQIHLDDKGTSTWQKLDGSRTVEEIGSSLELNFLSTDPKSEHHKFIEFISILYRNKFIDLDESKC